MKHLRDCKIRYGYRVIGNCTADGSLHCWYYKTLEEAQNFAQQLCETTGQDVDVCKYVGSYRIKVPVEFIKSED